MKPYYTQDVLITASRDELAKIRVALASWLTRHEDWKTSIQEDQKYWKEMRTLYVDVTDTLESLPF